MDYTRQIVAWGHGEWHDSNVEWKSQIARYVFNCSSDWNGDGAVNASDDAMLIDFFLKGDTQIDIDGDDVVETDDLITVLELQKSGK